MVVGLGRFDTVGHATAALDGAAGILVLSPGAVTRAAIAAAAARRAGGGVAESALLRLPARTADGEAVKVLLNLSDPRELAGPDPAICDGVGVVRTEFCSPARGCPMRPRSTPPIAASWTSRPASGDDPHAGRGGDKPIPG